LLINYPKLTHIHFFVLYKKIYVLKIKTKQMFNNERPCPDKNPITAGNKDINKQTASGTPKEPTLIWPEVM